MSSKAACAPAVHQRYFEIRELLQIAIKVRQQLALVAL
jgi:hypothetical protein